MAGKLSGLRLSLVSALACALPCPARPQTPPVTGQIPQTSVTALNGQPVSLPADLRVPGTILILGFGRHSQDATTAWERAVRTGLARPGAIGFYDMAMLAEVPGFVRPFVVRSIKRAVPDVLKPQFLPLTENEDAWKRVAGYAADQPEAAYVLLVDRSGGVQWRTHAQFSDAGFAQLRDHANALAGATR